MKACGYAIVRRPDQNPQFEIGGKKGPVPKLKDEVYYSGCDRMNWFDFKGLKYQEQQPKKFYRLNNYLDNARGFKCDFLLIKEYEIVELMLLFNSEISRKNEIIALHSPNLESVLGTIKMDQILEFCGFDVYVDGFGSVLLNGIFSKEDYFKSLSSYNTLNAHGLFDSIDLASAYLNDYSSVFKEANFEPIADLRRRSNYISVARQKNIGKLYNEQTN